MNRTSAKSRRSRPSDSAWTLIRTKRSRARSDRSVSPRNPEPGTRNSALPAQSGGRGAKPGNDKGSAVWVLVQDRPTRVPVQPGISDGRDTAILDGDLTPGTAVLTGTTSTAAPAAAPST